MGGEGRSDDEKRAGRGAEGLVVKTHRILHSSCHRIRSKGQYFSLFHRWFTVLFPPGVRVTVMGEGRRICSHTEHACEREGEIIRDDK